MQRQTPKLKSEKDCTGCGACIVSCSKGAITKKSVGMGAWIPLIDQNKCIQCGKCEMICNRAYTQKTIPYKAYIAYNRDEKIRLKSASGGVFSALATYVIDHGGSVFGAEMRFDHGRAIVEHNCITQIQELPRILGSKYVQSDSGKSYETVKKELIKGKIVLFSGCSCQIDGLKKYLGDTDQTKLYTIDLICHGVPGIELFNEYIQYLGKRYKGNVRRFSFRTKETNGIDYKITATLDEKSGGYYLK
ncbi:hypothetical protein K380107A5_19380 [Holdemania massiliensis]|jgi:coenzyme F420-reducing hydrogenase beta subunit|uniref:Coenzyme F420 hydrogenase/dehydrogenase, beta subunit C-terminal domain n=1 Tax=Holdemania massiliensis TaxID=1468449 RepID=UPI0036F1E640